MTGIVPFLAAAWCVPLIQPPGKMQHLDGHAAAASPAVFSNAHMEVEPNTSAHPCPNSKMLCDSPVMVEGIWLCQGREHSCPKLGYMELSNNLYYLHVAL